MRERTSPQPPSLARSPMLKGEYGIKLFSFCALMRPSPPSTLKDLRFGETSAGTLAGDGKRNTLFDLIDTYIRDAKALSAHK